MKTPPVDLIHHYPHEVFPRTCLAMVLTQVRYPSLARLEDRIPDFQEALRSDYPLFRQETGFEIVIKEGAAETRPAGHAYRFSSIDENWSIVVTKDFATLESRNYNNVDDLTERVSVIWREIQQKLDPQYQLRFGLRFINEFRVDFAKTYSDWRGLLNEQLMGMDPEKTFNATVEQFVAELLMPRDDYKLAVRRGFLTGTTTPHLAGKEHNGPFYLLDLDCASDDKTAFEANPVKRLRKYDEALYDIFMMAIDRKENPKLLNWLRGKI